MVTWRFYQGLRTEWQWYRLDDFGNVIAKSDRGFSELRACMKNAETAGFTGAAYHVQVRQAGAFSEAEGAAHEAAQDRAGSAHRGTADEQPAS
jgi:hypothetical protein